jgi:hypothetical protein
MKTKFIGVDSFVNGCACCGTFNNVDDVDRVSSLHEYVQVGRQYICTDCVHAAYVCLLKEKSGG